METGNNGRSSSLEISQSILALIRSGADRRMT